MKRNKWIQEKNPHKMSSQEKTPQEKTPQKSPVEKTPHPILGLVEKIVGQKVSGQKVFTWK